MCCGENLLQRFCCKTGTQHWKIWTSCVNILTVTHLDQLCRVYISERGLFTGACLSSSIMKKEGILLLRCSSTGHSKLVLVTVLTECVDLQVDSIAHLMAYTWTHLRVSSDHSQVHFCIILQQNSEEGVRVRHVISHLEEILCNHVSDCRQNEFIFTVVMQIVVVTSEYDFIICPHKNCTNYYYY